MKTRKDIQAYIQNAKDHGSDAKTLQGAGRYMQMISKAQCPFNRISYKRHDRRINQALWHQQGHLKRLLLRYAGSADRTLLVKLNKGFLSPFDYEWLKSHETRTKWQDLLSLPIYVRAFYLDSELKKIPGLKREIKKWEKLRGELAINNHLRAHSFNSTNWGRLRKRNNGYCNIQAGIKTESNGRYGWNKVVWNYADYIHIVPANPGNYFESYYVSTNGVRHRVFNSPYYIKINSGKPFPIERNSSLESKFPIHIQRRILEPHVPKVLTLGYDRVVKTLTLTDGFGEIYHLTCFEIKNSSRAKSEINAALRGLRRRRAEKINLEKVNLSRVFVQLTDSTDAGNCQSMSESFASQIFQSIGAVGDCAIRADEILKLREDSYTKRAINFAASR